LAKSSGTAASSTTTTAKEKETEAPAKGTVKAGPAANSVTLKKKKIIGTDRSEFMPEENNFGFVFSYWAGYDHLEQVQYKTVKHQLGISGSYSFDKALSIYSAIGLGYSTYKNKIFKENDDDSYGQLSNLDIGAVYAFRPKASFLRMHSNTFNVSLPVSEESRFDQHRGEYTLTNFLFTQPWHGFSLANRVTAEYLKKKYKFSVFNDGQLNRDLVFMESISLIYQVIDIVSLRFGVAADYTRYLDDSWDMNFGNQASIIVNYWGAQFFATMVNRSYPENERMDFGYYDRYRRLYRVGITYAF